MFKSVRIDITSSVRWMWTVKFTYFDSKCMHLSKLLHNHWSICIDTNVVTSVRIDVNRTVYIFIFIYIFTFKFWTWKWSHVQCYIKC